jgi:hypothetical protein
VFVNRVLRKISGHKRNRVAGDWRRLHDEDLHDLHSSSNINRVIKLRIIRLVGHVARSGKEALHTGFVWGSLWERDNVEDLSVGGKILQKNWSLRKTGMKLSA